MEANGMKSNEILLEDVLKKILDIFQKSKIRVPLTPCMRLYKAMV